MSIILTLIPYYLVVNNSLPHDTLVVTVIAIAIAQLLIQVIYFLHLSLRPEDRSTTLSFVFTIIVVLILVVGSLWIMYNLTHNMMMS
jgi:cytochrome o ubiquinol oxidase operon protein cyoD